MTKLPEKRTLNLQTMKLIFIFLILFAVNVMAGYEIHISKGNWWESDKTPISLDAWKNICESDPELRFETSISTTNPNTEEIITIQSEGICFWSNPKDNIEYVFNYSLGKITFSHSNEIILKAEEIAKKLGANLQGDEGETY